MKTFLRNESPASWDIAIIEARKTISSVIGDCTVNLTAHSQQKRAQTKGKVHTTTKLRIPCREENVPTTSSLQDQFFWNGRLESKNNVNRGPAYSTGTMRYGRMYFHEKGCGVRPKMSPVAFSTSMKVCRQATTLSQISMSGSEQRANLLPPISIP